MFQGKIVDFKRWLEILDWSREYSVRMGVGDKSTLFD